MHDILSSTPYLSFICNIKYALDKHPDLNLDCLSRKQLISKQWLINELSNVRTNLGTTFILGGWYGTLASMMFESRRFQNLKIRSFDIDPYCATVADSMNRIPWVMDGWQFKASTADMYDLDYTQTEYISKRANGTTVSLQDKPNTIINTSCEHLAEFEKWWDKIPLGMFVVLQSNNAFQFNDHVNCMNSLAEFEEKVCISTTRFSGVLDLGEYERYMIIGEK